MLIELRTVDIVVVARFADRQHRCFSKPIEPTEEDFRSDDRRIPCPDAVPDGREQRVLADARHASEYRCEVDLHPGSLDAVRAELEDMAGVVAVDLVHQVVPAFRTGRI